MRKCISTILMLSLLGLASLAPRNDDSSSDSDSDSTEHGVVSTDVKTNCTCGVSNKDDQRIVGGKATLVNEFPLMVGLVRRDIDTLVCGGTILTARHVITAAHCTDEFEPSELGVHVGHHNYQEVKSTTKLLEPQEFFIYEDFHYMTLKYDISIILMKKSIEFGKNVSPVCLPTSPIPLEGERVKVLGWGHTKYRGSLSDVLLKVNLDVQALDFCSDANPHLELDDRHQLCTFRKNKDSCNGDSGGPVLLLNRQTNRWTLVGITSYGYNCAKHPAVATSLTYFLSWIQKIISRTDPSYQTCAQSE